MNTIDFYFDFISPYAYLANARLPSIAEKYGCALNYRPIDLQAAKVAAGNTGPASAQIPPKFRYATTDLMRWARKYGVPFAIPQKKPGDTAGASRENVGIPKELLDSSRANKAVYFARKKGRERAFIDLLYRNTFGAGILVGNDSALRDTVSELGWSVDDVFEFVHSEDAAGMYEDGNKAAQARGVFGVPTMMVDDQMWWGNDRLDMLEEYLAQRNTT